MSVLQRALAASQSGSTPVAPTNRGGKPSVYGGTETTNNLYDNAMNAGGEQFLSGDGNTRNGQIQGMSRATDAYGQNYLQTGQNVQDIIQRRRSAMEGSDPASSEMREGRNREVAMARARGAGEGEIAQLTRDTETRIDRQRFERQDKTLGDYQRLIGNVLGNQLSLESAYAGIGAAQNSGGVASGGGGALGSVICTELYNQGYMSIDMFIKDGEYGAQLRMSDPAVYAGYIAWAPTVVKWMQKSRLVTALVAVPGMAWARNMAGDKNLLGAFISKIGEPICRFIGRKSGQVQSA